MIDLAKGSVVIRDLVALERLVWSRALRRPWRDGAICRASCSLKKHTVSLNEFAWRRTTWMLPSPTHCQN